MADDNDKGNNSKKKSFIGKLIDDLEINKDNKTKFEDVQKRKLNPNIVEYDWEEDSPLKGRRILITKKSDFLRKNYNDSTLDKKHIKLEDDKVEEDILRVSKPKKVKKIVHKKIDKSKIEDKKENLQTSNYKEENKQVNENNVGKNLVREEVPNEKNIEEKTNSEIKKEKAGKNSFNFRILKDKLSEIMGRFKNDKEDENKVQKRKFPIKFIYLITSLACVFLLFLGIMIVSGGDSVSLDNVSKEFIQRLEEGNTEKIEEIVSFEGKNTESYKKSISNFVKLYKEDNEFKEYVKTSVESDVKNIQENKNYKTKNLIGIVEAGKKHLLFPGYKVKISPLSINTESIVEKTIKIGDEREIIKGEMLVIPGVYDIITEFEFLKLKDLAYVKYQNNEANYNLNLGYSNSEIYNDSFDLQEGNYKFEIRNADDEALVFIDGKNTNKTVEEFNEMEGKNLDDGNSIAVLNKSAIGYGLSDSIALINADGSAKFKVNYENNLMLDKFISMIKTTLQNDSKAFRNSDINMLTTLGGEELDAAIGWINKNIGNNQYYIRDYMSYLVDKDSFDVKEGGYFSSTSAYVGGYLNYKEGKFSNDDKNPDLNNLDEYVDKKTGFHFKFDEDEKAWYVDLWGTTYRSIETNNTLLLKLK
ncbi:TcaA second domain-containing protein [Miniphocaeibacter massiliensis]|uniref:TcaA second domain-containing protein n=1 Tax=Miniphocaeibacter massiliensis TaxID=2041841 RepID=UPI000C085085|nr:hypothetical protein [Miniphocaeibacter massiliensis]